MGMFINPTHVLREDAQDYNPEERFDSSEVKDVIEDLADALDEIPELKSEPETSNGGQPIEAKESAFTAEMVPLLRLESTTVTGRPKFRYLVEYNMLRHFMEENDIADAGDATAALADGNTDIGMTPAPDGGEPQAADVAIDQAQIVVVAPPAEAIADLAAAAKQEAAHGFKGLAFQELATLTRDLQNKNVNWRIRG